jgi:hypothetical protein
VSISTTSLAAGQTLSRAKGPNGSLNAGLSMPRWSGQRANSLSSLLRVCLPSMHSRSCCTPRAPERRSTYPRSFAIEVRRFATASATSRSTGSPIAGAQALADHDFAALERQRGMGLDAALSPRPACRHGDGHDARRPAEPMVRDRGVAAQHGIVAVFPIAAPPVRRRMGNEAPEGWEIRYACGTSVPTEV